MSEATIHLEIPFHDVDLTGVGWHGHVYRYFEIARTDLFRQARLDVDEMKNLGVRVAITETRSRHIRPLPYGERVSVRAEITAMTPAVQVDYQIRLSDGTLAVRGRTTLAAVTPDGSSWIETPQVVIERLESLS